jgi:hypothetical protein
MTLYAAQIKRTTSTIILRNYIVWTWTAQHDVMEWKILSKGEWDLSVWFLSTRPLKPQQKDLYVLHSPSQEDVELYTHCPISTRVNGFQGFSVYQQQAAVYNNRLFYFFYIYSCYYIPNTLSPLPWPLVKLKCIGYCSATACEEKGFIYSPRISFLYTSK